MTIDFGHANPNAKFRVSMSSFGWFPDQVHLEGYNDEEVDAKDADGQRLEDIRNQRRGQLEDDESDLSELTDED